MGLLDEAIRDHLDLKRRSGADPAEIERLEREALGPVRRGGMPEERPQFADDAPPAGGANPDPSMETRPLTPADETADPLGDGAFDVTDGIAEPFDDDPLDFDDEDDEPKSRGRRRFGLFGRRRKDEDDFEDDDFDFDEPDAEAEWQPEAPAPPASQPTSAFTPEFAPEPDFDSAPEAEVVEPDAHFDEPEPIEPSPRAAVPEPSAPSAPAAPDDRYYESDPASSGLPARPRFTPAPGSESAADSGDAQTNSDFEAPSSPGPDTPDPHATVEYRVAASEDRFPLDEDADPAPSRRTPIWHERDRPPAQDWADDLDDEPFADDRGGREPEPELEDEDVLEETPDFLQDTPDHDRLWFEQKPPKDFDFDN